MSMRSLLVLCAAVLAVYADTEFANDPYLAYRPPFARSLPVQIMLTGVVLTLVAVLFIHLLFTAQYHWPLAPVNYVLQLSGVTTLLISLIATIHVVLSAAFAESKKWPYMLSYIAVNVPPLDIDNDPVGWSIAERATWLVMNASTSGLIQITHIQFLTILYPSRLEGRLIFTLLGPLAVVAAIMQLLPISGSTFVYSIATAVRNVCNATLSLLFTLALFIWGLLVNRKQAWRTDGGTAVFGAAALSLAVVSTALNFLYVHKAEEFVWLPGLMWAVVLWQSFLGWWWWVGAGSGAGAFASEDENMQEKLRREAKREVKKKEARERRKETRIKAQRVWKGVAGAFSTGAQANTRSRASVEEIPESSTPNQDQDLPTGVPPRRTRTNVSTSTSATLTTPSITSTSSTSALTFTTLPRLLPGMIYRYYASLRHAHNAAARVQAAERVKRMREVGRGGREGRAGPSGGDAGSDEAEVEAGVEVEVEGWGWGWEGFGWRRRWRAGAKAGSGRKSDVKEGSPEPSPSPTRGRSRSRRRDRRGEDQEAHELQERVPRTSRRARVDDVDEDEGEDDMYVSEVEPEESTRRSQTDHDRDDRIPPPPPPPPPQTQSNRTHQPPPLPLPLHLPQPPQQPAHSGSTRNVPTPNPNVAAATAAAAARPRSLWWWGPLWRWRLQDSTVYK